MSSLNKAKNGPEQTLHLDTFHAVIALHRFFPHHAKNHINCSTLKFTLVLSFERIFFNYKNSILMNHSMKQTNEHKAIYEERNYRSSHQRRHAIRSKSELWTFDGFQIKLLRSCRYRKSWYFEKFSSLNL